MVIGSKYQFYQLYKQGLLGNTLRQFNTINEALESDVQVFGLREVGVAGGGAWQRVNRRDLLDEGCFWIWAKKKFNIDEAAPDSDVQLQGEVCRTIRGWEGYLGVRTGQPMRYAMSAGLLLPRQGLVVPTLLDHFLDPSSRNDFDDLLELFPNATIEFASYPYDLGKIPGRNTVIWEVRNY